MPPVSVQRPASIPTDVIAPGPISIAPGVPRAPTSQPPRAPSQPPVIGTPAPGQVRASAQQGAVSRAPNGPKSKPGSEQVPESIRRRASERLASGGQPGLSAGSVIVPPRRKVPWLLLVIDLAMIIGGALFIRAALAKGDASAAPGDPAGSGSAVGSGSSTTSVEPITNSATGSSAAIGTPGSGSAPTPVLHPTTGSSGGTLRPPTGTLRPPTGSGGGTSGGGSSTTTSGGGSSTTTSGGGSSTSSGGGGGSTTIDPYPPDAAPVTQPDDNDKNADDLATQVTKLSSRSQSKFDHCYVTATKSLPPEQALNGDIEIAFQILGTGEIRNAAVVSDTTGSAELGRCLLAVISTWQFTANGGGPTDFVRPFHFSGH